MTIEELIKYLEECEDGAYLRYRMIRSKQMKAVDGKTMKYYDGRASAFEQVRFKLLGLLEKGNK